MFKFFSETEEWKEQSKIIQDDMTGPILLAQMINDAEHAKLNRSPSICKYGSNLRIKRRSRVHMSDIISRRTSSIKEDLEATHLCSRKLSLERRS